MSVENAIADWGVRIADCGIQIGRNLRLSISLRLSPPNHTEDAWSQSASNAETVSTPSSTLRDILGPQVSQVLWDQEACPRRGFRVAKRGLGSGTLRLGLPDLSRPKALGSHFHLREGFTSGNRVIVEATIQRENTVEVVDFVLQEFRQTSLCAQPLRFSPWVGVSDLNRLVTGHLHQQVRKAEAVVPEREGFLGAPRDLGIDEDQALVRLKLCIGFAHEQTFTRQDVVHVNEADARQLTDLWGGNTTAPSGRGPKPGQGVIEVLDDRAHAGVLHIGHTPGSLP